MEKIALNDFIDNYGDAHRKILQLMLKKGAILTSDFLRRFIGMVNEDLPNDEDKVNFEGGIDMTERDAVDRLLNVINEKIQRAKFRITRADYEFKDNAEYIVLISQLQSNRVFAPVAEYSAEERGLIMKWFQEICSSSNAEITEVVALNFAEGNVTKRRAQGIIDLLVTNLFLEKTEDAMLRFGIRGVYEVLPLLAEFRSLEVCSNCGRAVVFKKLALQCLKCKCYIHRQCILKLCKYNEAGSTKCPQKLNNGEFCAFELNKPLDVRE